LDEERPVEGVAVPEALLEVLQQANNLADARAVAVLPEGEQPAVCA
jgi:hypothetical protein